MRVLLAILVLVLLLLQYQLWLGEGGFSNVRRLEEKVKVQAAENEMLELRNQELRAEVEDLRQGYEAIEERARSELGMIREDEQFYQVVPDPGPQPVAEPAAEGASDAGSEPGAHPESDPESEPEPGSEYGSEPEPESQAEPDARPAEADPDE